MQTVLHWHIPSVFSSTLSTTSHSLKCHLLNLHYCVPQRYVLSFTCISSRCCRQYASVLQRYVLSFTCISSRCCRQYASVLQAGIIFQAINWLLFFYIPEQKGPVLVVSVIKHTSTTTQNTKLLHILCMPDNYLPLAALQSDSVLYILVLVSHQKKNWLCWKRVINYAVRSAILWDFTQRRIAILTTIVLLTLEDETYRLSRNVGS